MRWPCVRICRSRVKRLEVRIGGGAHALGPLGGEGCRPGWFAVAVTGERACEQPGARTRLHGHDNALRALRMLRRAQPLGLGMAGQIPCLCNHANRLGRLRLLAQEDGQSGAVRLGCDDLINAVVGAHSEDDRLYMPILEEARLCNLHEAFCMRFKLLAQ